MYPHLSKAAQPAAEPVVERLSHGAPTAPEYMRTEAAARYTGLSPQWFELARTKGGGPPYIKLSHAVLYKKSDLDAFFAARRVTSTSDADSRRAQG